MPNTVTLQIQFKNKQNEMVLLTDVDIGGKTMKESNDYHEFKIQDCDYI